MPRSSPQNYPSQNALYCGAFGLCGNFTDAKGHPLRFDRQGNPTPIDFVSARPQPLRRSSSVLGRRQRLRPQPGHELVTPLERYSGVGLLNYELTDRLRFPARSGTATASGELVDQPAIISAAFARRRRSRRQHRHPHRQSVPVPGSPRDHPGERSPGGRGFFLARANTDISTRQSIGEVDIYRFVAGLEGKFEVDACEWEWNVIGNYGRSRTKGRNPEIIEQNFNNAVDAVAGSRRPTPSAGRASPIRRSRPPAHLRSDQPVRSTRPARRRWITSSASPRRARSTAMCRHGEPERARSSISRRPVRFRNRLRASRETFDFDPGPLLLGGPGLGSGGRADGDGDPTNDCTSFTRDACSPLWPEASTPTNSSPRSGPDLLAGQRDGGVRCWNSRRLPVGRSLQRRRGPGLDGGRALEPVRDITFRGNFTRSIR